MIVAGGRESILAIDSVLAQLSWDALLKLIPGLILLSFKDNSSSDVEVARFDWLVH